MDNLNWDLADKVYLVTGANSGIGYEAALNFANRGATLALICRSKERGEKTLAALRELTGNKRLSLYLADFCSLKDVSKLAQQLLADFPQIDVLCNNAGAANGSRVETDEGFEQTFVANHLASFLLTKQLLPALLKVAEQEAEKEPARVVFTSSLGHTSSALNFDDLNMRRAYHVLTAYGRSKLMNLLTARELQRLVGDKKLIASSFHPGTVRTQIWSKGGILAKCLGFFMYPFMLGVKEGADTLIWLASSNDKGSLAADGNYFYKRQREKTAEFATDEAATKLWQVSEDLVRPYVD